MIHDFKNALYGKLHLLISGIFFVTVLAMSSCTFDQAAAPPVPTACDSLSVGFAADVMPIFTANCSDQSFGSCHFAGTGLPDFTNYNGIKATVDNGKLDSRMLTVKDMPPTYSNGPLSVSADDLQIVSCWIDAGAQDN